MIISIAGSFDRKYHTKSIIMVLISNPKHTDDSQWLVRQGLLAHLQDGVSYSSGLQEIHTVHFE